jgi:GNAT superfamily N-acetyltransferase
MDLHTCIDPPVLIRPIRRDDGDRLSASHTRLSPESRYRRFLSAKPELTGADVRYLVEVDGIDHIALVATQPWLPDEPIVAVARCIRIPDSPDSGEMAIVVADALQGQGVGTQLVGRLAELAVAQGITRFRAVMLSEYERLAVPSQPRGALAIVWAPPRQQRPEPGRVVQYLEMADLVPDHVVEHLGRCQQQAPVEAHRAGA